MELEEGKPVFKNRAFGLKGLFYFIPSPIGSTGHYWVRWDESQWFVPGFVPSIAQSSVALRSLNTKRHVESNKALL